MRTLALGIRQTERPQRKSAVGARTSWDQLVALRARCERQTGSIFTPMGDEMYYRYQRSLIEQAIDTVAALPGRPVIRASGG